MWLAISFQILQEKKEVRIGGMRGQREKIKPNSRGVGREGEGD